jgi:hypothetical protein
VSLVKVERTGLDAADARLTCPRADGTFTALCYGRARNGREFYVMACGPPRVDSLVHVRTSGDVRDRWETKR